MRATLPVAALLLSMVLGGCAGSSAPQSNEASGGGAADADAVGALQGSVYDDERRPIEGANVGLFPLGKNDTTDANGRFSFRQIPVGDYVLQITKAGYFDTNQNASVAPRRTTSLVSLIVPLPADVSYHFTFPYVGNHQCMVYTNVFLGSCSHPYTAAHGTLRSNGVNLSQFGAPTDVLKNNYRYNFSADRGHTEIVSELVWKAQTDASRYFVLQLSCAWYNAAVKPGETTWANENTYVKARGVSPLRVEWSAHESQVYEKKSTWIMSRAYLSGPADRPAGVAVDQKFEMYNTVFYGAPAPDGWSVSAPT
jgi:hypothetical protein